MDEMGVIAKMRGIAVHDGWKPYRSYDVVHQLCNAHHLRELEGVGRRVGPGLGERDDRPPRRGEGRRRTGEGRRS